MFPLTDARGRIVGFQARKLREDDPLRGKYVNSPEGELFHKSAVLYGLSLARTSIAKQERAVVVEGNTDVIALRQAGFEPVVASMGTALTEQQLKELQRLTRRLYLCFDSDAAGEAATLRGMLLAAEHFEIRVVTMPTGTDPADDPSEFQRGLERSSSLGRHWARAEVRQATTRDEALTRVREVIRGFREKSGDWLDAVEEAADLLDLRPEVIESFRGHLPEKAGEQVRSVRDPGERLERDVLAACYVYPSLLGALEKLPAEHFDSEDNRRLREALLTEGEVDPDLTPKIAELDAVAATEAIDETTAKELILRLRERHLRRQLSSAGLEETAELQQKLLEIRDAVEQLA
jgi:DNA primase